VNKKLCTDELETTSLSLMNGSHRETDDFYFRVIARLNDRFRLIRCKDGIQWIIQKRDGSRNGRPRWTGCSYCTSLETVQRLALKHCNLVEPQAIDKIKTLIQREERHDR
jgi:hypothetical protein